MKVLKIRESSTTNQAVVHYSHMFQRKERIVINIQGAWYWRDNRIEVPEVVALKIRENSHD